MVSLIFILVLVATAQARDITRETNLYLAIQIDMKSGVISKVMTDQMKTICEWTPCGIHEKLFVPGPEKFIVDPQADLTKTEPIVANGMFQGWREIGCCPLLELRGRPTKENPELPIVVGNGEPGRRATIVLDGPNLAVSSKEFLDYPHLAFDQLGEIRFRIRVKDSSPWIIHINYRGQCLEIRDQWSVLEDF